LQIDTNCGLVQTFLKENQALQVVARPLAAEGRSASSGCINVNDDWNRLLDLMTCIDCKQTMKIEGSDPDDTGKELLRYRCEKCGRIEIVASWLAGSIVVE
jgi:hypothetical protein